MSSPVEKESAHAASSRRMRLHRARRKLGLRCVTIPLCEAQIETLVHRGLLARGERADQAAIRSALYSYLDLPLWRATLGLLAVRVARHSGHGTRLVDTATRIFGR